MPAFDVTNPDHMRELQGDRLLVYRHAGAKLEVVYVLTLIRVMEETGQSLRMVNREGRVPVPDWPFTQKWCDHLRPAPPNNDENARWAITLKTA